MNEKQTDTTEVAPANSRNTDKYIPPYTFIILVVALDVARSWYSRNFYQEIDWPCYAKDAEMVLSGEFDYSAYLCEWGRMYYPAMFAWFYAGLYWITGGTLQTVLTISVAVKGLITFLTLKTFCPLMKRRHWWIFLVFPVLEQNVYRAGISRVTNDLYLALFFITIFYGISRRRVWLSSIAFALAVSYKMNSLFFGPPLLLSYLYLLPFTSVVLHFGFMGIMQILLALPFLLTNARAYISIAFNFSRDFEHRVNMAWGFLGDEMRHNPMFYRLLLVLMLLFFTILLVLCYKRLVTKGALSKLVPGRHTSERSDRQVTWVLLLMLAGCNMVGYTFSRGVHIQFYLWIAYSLPFLLTQGAGLNSIATIALYLLLDWCHSWVPNVIRLDMLVFGLYNLFTGNLSEAGKLLNADIFGQLRSVDLETHATPSTPLVPMLGKYFNEGFSVGVIPASFILFSIEIFILWRMLRRLKM